MMHRLHLTVFLGFLVLGAGACDHCGCDLAYGIVPTDDHSMVWFGFRKSEYTGYLTGDDSHTSLRDLYFRTDVNFRQSFSRSHMDAIVSLPMIRYYQYSGKYLRNKYLAFGDASVMVRKFFQSKVTCPWSHRFVAGMGLEIPTGRTNVLKGTSRNLFCPARF